MGALPYVDGGAILPCQRPVDFHHRQRIQVAVGAELVGELLLNGRIPLPYHRLPNQLRLRPVLHIYYLVVVQAPLSMIPISTSLSRQSDNLENAF